MLFSLLKNNARLAREAESLSGSVITRPVLVRPGELLKNLPYFCTPSKYPCEELIKKEYVLLQLYCEHGR